MIEVKNLTKKYGDVTAVNDISFEVKKGEILGFLGPNAAGKTTTMRMLTGYMLPQEGTAKVAGLDIFESSFEIKKHIGYLPENNPLYEDIQVIDYLDFIAEIRGISNKKERVKEIVKICSLEKVIKKDIGELSKGYKQRVGLAQAMIHNPEILILDEPTSGLDPKQIVEIRSLIKDLGKEKTVILSTHILSEVEATCTQVLIINNGKIVISGTPKELQNMSQGESRIFVKIRGNENIVLPKIQTISQVKEVSVIERNNEIITYEVFTKEKNEKICEEIYFLTRDNGWSLLELKPEKTTLENIFLSLTAS
ncbi:MAG: ATP-binding cassette domain-containing protein [bacterium]